MIGQTVVLKSPASREGAKRLVDLAPEGAVLPVETLRLLLRLDEGTGNLFWNERSVALFSTARNPEAARRRWNTRYAGKQALTADDGHGYAKGAIFNRTYKAHRVVFALAYGRWPRAEIDHVDGDRRNNAISNLREATRAENVRNAAMKRSGRKSSAYKGVRRHNNGWVVQCKGEDGRQYRGYFVDEEEAARAYDKVAREQHGAFAKVNFA